MRVGIVDRSIATYRVYVERQMARKLGVPTSRFGVESPGVFRKCPIGMAYLDPLVKTGHYTREITSIKGATAVMKGREFVTFSRCDYLGLTTHPRVIEAAIRAIEKHGTSVSSSRLAAGTTELHNLLEQRMAEFVGGEACIVYIMGYLANLGAIPALVGKGEFVVVDAKSHASIVDACSLAQKQEARVVIYKHNDMADLARKLERCGHRSNKLIVMDGVFSMEGDLAPLDEIQRLARIHNAGVFVDDAHGAGVMGVNGSGTPEVFNLRGEIDLTMVTLSKAFPGIGGCIIGRKEVIDFLKVTSRSFIFNLSLPPHMIAIALTALDVIKEEPGLRQRLRENAEYMKGELRRSGYDIGKAEAAIIPVFIRDDEKANRLTDMLEQAGFIVDPMVHPAVGRGEALIRLVITAAHSPDDLAKAVGVFDYAGKQLGII